MEFIDGYFVISPIPSRYGILDIEKTFLLYHYLKSMDMLGAPTAWTMDVRREIPGFDSYIIRN